MPHVESTVPVPIDASRSHSEACDSKKRRLGDSLQQNFGHLGDGNLHYNVQAPVGIDPALFLREQEAAVNHIVYEAVASHGGSISAEHRIGQLKREALLNYQSPVAMQMMRAIKEALDPQGLMNPGRVV